MSAHKCPKCKEYGFHWRTDEEESPLTIWNCWECKYHAFENEADQRPCTNCDYQHQILLKDETGEYWWCGKCEATINN